MAYIIAEIGFNHEGNIDTATEMVKSAAKAGANAVKFQTFRASDIALPSSPHYEAIKCGEMSLEQHLELYNAAKDCGIDFISTPFSPWAVELLEKVGIPAYKVASMDCTNKHLLRHIAQTGKPIYLSTGMATLNEIADTLDYLKNEKSGPVTLLHCISIYPANAEYLNLDIIPFLKQLFDVPVGYSDHYPGTKACLAAAMIGADIIETHFTLDSSKEGGDHFHSVEPTSFRNLISDIELFRIMKGSRRGIFDRPDRQYAKDYRRGLYSVRGMTRGDVLKEENVLLCRPASELSTNDVDWLMGKVLDRDLSSYEPLKRSLLKNG